jgi:hypothetical protein
MFPRFGSALWLVIGVVVFIPISRLAAQEQEQIPVDPPLTCGYFWSLGCENDSHAVVSAMGGVQTNGTHSACKICVIWDILNEEWVELDWEECHGECQSGFARSASGAFDAYEAALRAGSLGDITSVLKLAAAVDGRIVYNAERKTVQVLNCTGTGIIGNFDVPPGLRVIAQSLPDVHTSMTGFAMSRHASGPEGASRLPLIHSAVVVLAFLPVTWRLARQV